MSDEPKGFWKYLWGICLGEKLPVWATLLGIVVGSILTAMSTFWIVPRLNESLERQKIRTDFVIKNLDDLNSRTRVLVAEIGDLHANVLRSNDVDAVAAQKVLSKITEMQWKAIELGIIFEDNEGGKIIQNYQRSLDDVRTAIKKLKSQEQLSESQEAIERFSMSSLNVIRALANLGGLRLNKTMLPNS